MKWKKLGKIFNPIDHKLINNCHDYAQSPQTLVFEDFVRIYFSTRSKDESGKYLSHISFVDFDKKFERIIKIADEEVIKLGNLGCFDEHGIFPINILKESSRILAYTTGWNRKVSVSNDASIGLAISENNGLTFTKIGEGPVLTSSLNEPFLVADAFVAKFDGLYHMWYIFGSKWIKEKYDDDPQRVYKIVHATSKNGIHWEKEGRNIISDKLNENECQALPTVIYFDNKYHLFFCYREAIGFRSDKNRSYKLGYAYSYNLMNWTRADENIDMEFKEEDWDSDMQCYPHAFHCDDNIYMLYNGNEFGRFGFGIAILEEF